MAKIDNWVVFPERIKLSLEYSDDLYTYYKQSPPNLEMIDDSLKSKLGPYVLMDKDNFNYHEIKEKNIVLFLSVSPKLREGWSVEYGLFRAALEIAAEESTGTWDPELHTILPDEMDDNSKANMEMLRAKVIGMNLDTGMISISFPKEGFEYGNLPQMLSVVVGNYNGMTSACWGVRLDDIDFPDDYANSYTGPTLGNEGIINILGDSITVGTIVKPKTGLSEADWAKTAHRSYLGGLDVVKDDENLSSQEYCNFYKRGELVLEKCKDVKEKTGRDVVYVSNVTCGDMDEMIKRGEFIRDHGGNCLMIDILAAGMGAVQTLNKKFPGMILHGHRAGHGAQTLFPELVIDGQEIDLRHGVSMKAWTLFARLGGIDQFHIGAPLGKMEKDVQTVLENLEACNRPLGNLKKMRAICSGGLKSTVLWDVASLMNPVGDEVNKDIVCQAGGGTHAHPYGTFSGAKSMIQARDSIMAKETPEIAMKKHFETLLAFRRWDNKRYLDFLKTLKSDDTLVVDLDKRNYPKDGKYTDPGPEPCSIIDAIAKFPELKEDLQKSNPELLK